MAALPVLAAGFAMGAAPQEPGIVRVSYALVNTTLTVREPVHVLVTIGNGMDDNVTVDLGPSSYANFRANLVRPDGRTESWPAGLIWLAGTPGGVTVPAHGASQRQLLVSRWFDFDASGRYMLELELVGKPPVVAGSPVPLLTKGEIVIDIDPRSPSRLQETCERIEKAVAESPTASEAREPAETLSYIRDPVAVPYLAELLSVEYAPGDTLVKGLERIADAAAVDTLISHIGTVGATGGSARAALARIQARTGDPLLKQKIIAALHER